MQLHTIQSVRRIPVLIAMCIITSHLFKDRNMYLCAMSSGHYANEGRAQLHRIKMHKHKLYTYIRLKHILIASRFYQFE